MDVLCIVGRRKINIELIPDERNRQVTFNKRKTGLMKKAMELAVLCNCRIGLIMFDGNGKLYDFRTEDMSSLVTNYFSQEVSESNDRDGLFQRYNGKGKGAQPTSSSNLEITDDLKLENLFEDGEKTDETVVDVESNSDGHVDVEHAVPRSMQRVVKRRKVRSHSPKREASTNNHNTPRFASANPGNGWSTFAARPAFVSDSAFSTAALQSPVMCNTCERHFKEEPFSASQQILRVEDTPSFMMSIPRQSSDGAYAPVSSVATESLHQQPMFHRNVAPVSRPTYFLEDPETRKLLEAREKNPNLSTSLMTAPKLAPLPSQGEMHPVPGQGSFPFFDNVADIRHAHMNSVQPQFSLEHGFLPQALSDIQHETMILQNLLHSGAPSYNFPTSSHNPAA